MSSGDGGKLSLDRHGGAPGDEYPEPPEDLPDRGTPQSMVA